LQTSGLEIELYLLFVQLIRSQSNELIRGTPELVHIGARALLDPKLIWFGSIACLSQLGGEWRGKFTCSSDFYLPSQAMRRIEEGGRGSAHIAKVHPRLRGRAGAATKPRLARSYDSNESFKCRLCKPEHQKGEEI
jgi:hypothetical protein